MVAAAIGDEVLWVRFPWLVDDLVDDGSSASAITARFHSCLTDFNPSTDLTSEGPWSIAFWICRKGSTTTQQFVYGMTGVPRYYAAFGTSGFNLLTIGIDASANTTSVTATVGVATHFAITFDGVSNLKIYKDGTLAQTLTTTGGGTLPNAAMSIGAQTGGSLLDQQRGALEDFRIFNRVLTAGEAATLAASTPSADAGSGGFSMSQLVNIGG